MKSKKSMLFLWISLAFSMILTAIMIAIQIAAYNHTISNIDIYDTQQRVGYEESLFFSVFFVLSSFGLELSCIRSVYKTLKLKPKGYVKSCYIISSALAFLFVAIFYLAYFGFIDGVNSNGHYYMSDICLSLIPAFIVSFILGSIPVKHDDR